MNRRKIYHGPPGRETSMYWEVAVSKARHPVTLEGQLQQGRRGASIGCGISWLAQQQPKAFPHPVYLVSVTASNLFAIDKLNKKGLPAHAVWYKHPYSWFIVANDKEQVAKLCADSPELLKGPFTFKVPRTRKDGGVGGINKPKGPVEPTHPHVVLRGCMKRARDAGLIDPVAARQIAAAMARE